MPNEIDANKSQICEKEKELHYQELRKFKLSLNNELCKFMHQSVWWATWAAFGWTRYAMNFFYYFNSVQHRQCDIDLHRMSSVGKKNKKKELENRNYSLDSSHMHMWYIYTTLRSNSTVTGQWKKFFFFLIEQVRNLYSAAAKPCHLSNRRHLMLFYLS